MSWHCVKEDKSMGEENRRKVYQLDDAADVYSKLSVSIKNRESWTVITPEGKSRSGFEIKGMRPSELDASHRGLRRAER